MHWNDEKSLRLSQVCIGIFCAVLAAADVGAYWLTEWYVFGQAGARALPPNSIYQILLMVSLYACSVPAWLVLVALGKLLANIAAGRVFTAQNVALLRRVSWCIIAAGLLCLCSAFYYLPFAIVAVAAGFMALIVRIVKNCFEQALRMKDELDFTI